MKFRNLKGNIMLFLAALIWGLAFVAQSSASETVEPFTFNAVRSYIGAGVLAAFFPVINRQEKELGIIRDKKRTLTAGIICGILLFLAVNFQQFGITYYPPEAAASGRSGFITALYIIIVPIIGIFMKKKTGIEVWIAAVIAVIGMYLLCFTGSLDSMYISDLIVFGCTLSFAFHIIAVDKFGTSVNGVKLSSYQFLTCAVLSTVCAFVFETPDIHNILAAWLPILYLGIMSSGVAYTFQILGQQYSSNPTVASIIMSFESVFAALFGWWIEGNVLSSRELAGCTVVFIAIIIAQLPLGSFFSKHKKQ